MEGEGSGEEDQTKRDKTRRGNRQRRQREPRNKNNQVYVANIPYEFDWTNVKDLFKEHVGDVSFVKLFKDDNNKSRGCGIVEFPSSELVKKSLEVMNRFPLQGRKLVLKEDFGRERDKYGNIKKDDHRGVAPESVHRMKRTESIRSNDRIEPINTYGLSVQFLDSIGVHGPLYKRLFVANLDYKVDRAKLKEIFKMAGKVRNVDLSTDKEGNSKGFAVVEYDHPVEAVQAISMFDQQYLYERKLAVRMDRAPHDKGEVRLPEGLKSIGMGLGPNGEPLRDIATTISAQSTYGGQPNNARQSLDVEPAATSVSLRKSNVSDLNSSVGLAGFDTTLGLQALGLAVGLGTLQNPFQQDMMTGGGGLQNMISQMPQTPMRMQDVTSSQFQNGNNNYMSRGSSVQMSQMLTTPDKNLSAPSNVNISDTVCISNLPPSITWQLLRQKFSEAGEIKNAEKTDVDVAMIQYYSLTSSRRAINIFDKTRIDGKTIRVDFC